MPKRPASEKQKTVLFLVLMIIVAVVWVPRFLKPRKTPPLDQRPEEAREAKRPSPLSGDLRNRQKALMDRPWGRNPFLAIGEEREKSYIAGISLTGILWDEKEPYAVINDAIVGLYGAVGTYFVKEITPEGVTLERDGEEYRLLLEEAD